MKAAVAAKESLCGYQVDDAARAHIRDAGYAEYFFHRTGHSIGVEVHGAGANMDNLETHDERRVIPWTCFSIEPGIYLPEFGIRSEVDVFVDETSARVTGEIQEKFKRLLSLSRRYRFHSTPMFLEFAAGLREYPCSPWSTVTYTPNGWKGPCYLIGKKFSETFEEFWNGTDWDYWESRQDSLCQNCAMHSGFEASVINEARHSPRDMMRLVAWNLTG